MRVFKSDTKNYLYFFYRLVIPIFNPIRFVSGIYGYSWFIRDIVRFKSMDKKAKLINRNLYPILDEKTSFTESFDPQNFYQQLWAFEQILKREPKVHIDIGSTYAFSGYVSKITKAVFIELRPIKTLLRNLEIKRGDILQLPIPNNSVGSLSSLCVAGHVGLGRYGDAIDPRGMEKACKELSRVLSKNGFLYFSTTIGKERICFNAHRVLSPKTIVKYFSGLQLFEFSVVDDMGKFHNNVSYKDYTDINYGLGMFVFKK